MADRTLDVWLNGHKVGRLDQEAGRIAFAYDEAYLASADATPLSASLPLKAEPFDDRTARPFFAGLLPDEGKRDQVARVLGVSARNDFALLDGIGGECAGAVTFVHPGETPVTLADAENYRLLDEGELASIIKDLPNRPLLAGEKDIRISLAGAQDKLPVLVVYGQIALPLQGAPSSHILKPAISRIDDSVANEGFCLELAAQAGLDVAHGEIRRAEDQPFLLVERYDRVAQAGGDLLRLHQEDFCQALGVPPEYKYEAEGGPTLVQAFDLVRKAARPAALFIPRLLDAVIFNMLVGNHDAHGKNYSLLYRPNGAVLSPLYDVLCTAAYPDLTPRLAMKVGGYDVFDQIMPRHWQRFAEAAHLAYPGVRRRVLDLAERLPSLAEQLHGAFADQGNDAPVLGRIVRLIKERCDATQRRFSEAKSV